MKTAAFSELPNNRFQNISIAWVGAALGLRFKFTVELQDGGVRQGLSMSGEHAMKRRENSAFPVNQRAVAVEGDGGEGREIHRGGVRPRRAEVSRDAARRVSTRDLFQL